MKAGGVFNILINCLPPPLPPPYFPFRYLGLPHLRLGLAKEYLGKSAAAGAPGAADRQRAAMGECMVRTVALCPGSGVSVLEGVKADVYLTGEMSHHEVVACSQAGVCVILTEHSNCERGYVMKNADNVLGVVVLE